MISNCWLRRLLPFPASFVQSSEMRELSWNIYIFFNFWNGWSSWRKHQKIYTLNVNTSASCATFDTVICWESRNLRESVLISLPLLIELTVGEGITFFRGRNSGADLFVCTKCYKRLSIKGRSAVIKLI